MANNAPSITGYFVVQARLTNLSPLYLGAGEGIDADKALSKSANGNQLIVNGSAVGGCIRSWIFEHYDAPTDEEKLRAWNYFWGIKMDNDDYQSHFIVKNSLVALKEKDAAKIEHVKIDPEKGTSADGQKFNREGLITSLNIPLVIEVPVYSYLNEKKGELTVASQPEFLNENQKSFIQGLLETIGSVLKNDSKEESFAIGASTNGGFGKIDCSDYQIYHFNFHGKNSEADAIQWFRYRNSFHKRVEDKDKDEDKEFGKIPKEKKPIEIPLAIKLSPKHLARQLYICMPAFIHTSLLTRLKMKKEGKGDGTPDNVQFKFNDDFVINGSSIKGAVLHQMQRILNTCLPDTAAKEFIKKLNGYAEEDKSAKSRFKVEMVLLKNVESIKQHRVKIDMFTQGHMPPAKFDSEPVWRDNSGKQNMELRFHIKNASNEEIALLLLTLRDFAEGFAAIGGEKSIGRGIIKPVDSKIIMKLGCGEAKTVNLVDLQLNYEVVKNYFKAWEEFVKLNNLQWKTS